MAKKEEPPREPLTDEEISEGEEIAIPAGDLTGAITEAVDDALEHDDAEKNEKK